MHLTTDSTRPATPAREPERFVMKPSPQYIVYLLGIIVLGLFYEPIKTSLGGQWLFFVSVVGYLLALRLLSAWVAKVRAQKEEK